MKTKKTKLITTAIVAIILVAIGFLVYVKFFKKNGVYPYNFDSAKITLSLKGSLSGSTTIYYKGDKYRKETSIQKTLTDGTKQNVDTLYISNGDTNYQVDLDTKTAVVSKNQQYEDLKSMSYEARAAYLNKLALGGTFAATKPTGTLTVAGVKCDLYKVGGGIEACLWNGIVVEEKFSIPSIKLTSDIEATSIEQNIQLSDDLFVLPKDIKVK